MTSFLGGLKAGLWPKSKDSHWKNLHPWGPLTQL